LFFLDSGDAEVAGKEIGQAFGEEEEDVIGGEVPAWSDSDDEKISVSLSARPQLRKLRRTEAEDVITGKEYSRRLRKQYVYSTSNLHYE
jgi:U3 small nucleolar RNA-associated protein 18